MSTRSSGRLVKTTNPNSKGRWHFPSMSTGKLEIVRIEGSTLVLKEQGSSYFGGIGRPQNYSPAMYYVYDIVRGSLEEGEFELEQLTSFLCRPIKGAADPYKP